MNFFVLLGTLFATISLAAALPLPQGLHVTEPLRAVAAAARRYWAEERENALTQCRATVNPLAAATRAANLDPATDPTLQNRQWGCHYELLWGRLHAAGRALVESGAVGVTEACNIMGSIDAGRQLGDRTLTDMLEGDRYDLGDAVINATLGYPLSADVVRVPMRGAPAHVDDKLVPAIREIFVIDLLGRELRRTLAADGVGVAAVVEFGAGWGRNLLNLRTHFPFLPATFHAGEYTAAGSRVSELLFRRYNPATRFSSFRFDYLFPDASPLLAYHGGRTPEKTLAFTIHSVEQVHNVNCSLIAEMRKTGEKVVGVHLEPVGFQISEALGKTPDEFDSLTKESSLLENQGFNANLVACVREAVARGEITVLTLESHVFDVSSAIVWEKLK
jgi:hypothetical protein